MTDHRRTGSSRSALFWVLVTALVVMPIAECMLIVTSVREIGGLLTLALLLASGMVGGWLIRREGSRAWRALIAAFGRGALPTGELADAALILAGGLMLLMPGFVTDFLGLLLILPATRPVFRRLAVSALAAKVPAAVAAHVRDVHGTTARVQDPHDVVVDGEVIEVDPRQVER